MKIWLCPNQCRTEYVHEGDLSQQWNHDLKGLPTKTRDICPSCGTPREPLIVNRAGLRAAAVR